MSERSVKAIFGEAIEKAPEERAAFLDGACRGDPELRTQVDALLEAWEQADQFLASPTAEESAPPEDDLEQAGSRIGVYKLLQQIGEGGMGTVYMAEQEEPVRRKVALKIIKLGMDTKQVIARFEAERQALAMMDHPNIAKVLDAGTTETGRPYFVMELVRGVAIQEYCDTNNVSTEQRLRLFIAICNAIQHAHQKGVIHRDLKPSNVLVTLHDGVPVPKVIDFGIAKATSSRLTDKTLFTEFRSFLGTPEYMSPEQAEMSGLDIDTRSDIYALGVLLYELLTGTTPFDAKTLRQAAFDELQRIIREDEPPKPSTRLSTLAGESLTKLARRQDTDAAGLSRVVRGDLDWIVMKALEKDRTRRYETASAMAEDVRRHLANEPVLASPPSLTYKLQKFVRRNKVAVVSVSAVVGLLLLGIAGTTWGLVGAKRQQRIAVDARQSAEESRVEAERQAEEARQAREEEAQQRAASEAAKVEALRAKELAESEAERARAVTDFLVHTLALGDPGVALAPDMTVQTVLERASKQIATRFQDQPEVEAALRSTIGQAYYSLGELPLAEPHLRRALELWDLGTEADPWTLYETMWPMTSVVFVTGSQEIEVFGSRVMQLSWSMLDDHPELVQHLGQLVSSSMAGRKETAQASWKKAMQLAREGLPPDDRRWRLIADNLFACSYTTWYFLGDPIAEVYMRDALEIYRRTLPETHTQVTFALDMLVSVLNGTGQFEKAEELVRESIRIQGLLFPQGHSLLSVAQARLGGCLIGQQRFEEAETILTNALANVDEEPYALSEILGPMIRLYDAWGQSERAETYRARLAEIFIGFPFAPSLDVIAPAFGPEHVALLEQLNRIQAFTRRAQGSRTSEDELREEFQLAVDDFLRERNESLDPTHPLGPLVARETLNWAQYWSSTTYFAQLRGFLVDDARSILEHWIDRLPTEYGKSLRLLAQIELHNEDYPRAEIMLRESLQLAQEDDAGSTLCAEIMMELVTALQGQGRLQEAETILIAAYPIYAEQIGELSEDTFLCARRIERFFRDQERSEEARPYVARQVAALKRSTERLPLDPGALIDSAHFLLSCEPADLRDADAAVLFAARAVQLTGGARMDYVDVLVRAYVEVDDYQGAVDALRDALGSMPAGNSWRDSFEARLSDYETKLR